MTHGALPHSVEVRTLAARGVVIDGVLDLVRMPRLQQAIAGADAPATARFAFSRDEEGRYIATLDVSMQVLVTCQRCLGPMSQQIGSRSLLAAVWNDEQAQALPARYDPLVTAEETDLWSVVEDELLLALPPFSYHAEFSCSEATGVVLPQEEEPALEVEAAGRENPFSVLAALKEDSNSD